MTRAARRLLVAFVAGLLFTVGLGVAGMTNPHKVLAFLDVFDDNWDPSLMFVMLGAIVVYAPAYQLLKKRSAPRLDDRFHWPTLEHVDAKLVLGSVLFGIGWGLSGLCPGPSVAVIITGSPPLLLSAAAMLAGMLAHRALTRTR